MVEPNPELNAANPKRAEAAAPGEAAEFRASETQRPSDRVRADKDSLLLSAADRRIRAMEAERSNRRIGL